MPLIGVTAISSRWAQMGYIQSLERRGALTHLFTPKEALLSEETLMRLDGLLLTGGPDVDPALYGEEAHPATERPSPELDRLELSLIRYALARDMPILAICRGMQMLNVALGGKLIQDIPGHRRLRSDGRWESAYHDIEVLPGSKLAAVLGSGGLFRVNSRHHQGLKDAQRSPRLTSSAYCPEDGIVEGLESPRHSWVLGIQCHPERESEVDERVLNLFTAFIEKAEEYSRTKVFGPRARRE
jgi:putative glutamine amidotransferase